VLSETSFIFPALGLGKTTIIVSWDSWQLAEISNPGLAIMAEG
jgi:hypothetical protein